VSTEYWFLAETICTFGIVDERAVDVQLYLAFFAMFWQFFPVIVGDVRFRLDA
jgi:hypothetical protein